MYLYKNVKNDTLAGVWVFFKRCNIPRSLGNICSVWRTVSTAPCWQSRSTAPEQSARADRTFRPVLWITELLMNCIDSRKEGDCSAV